MSLEAGLKALQEQHYSEAIALLLSYCQSGVNKRSPYYIQAQIALARAYRGNHELDKATNLCEHLTKHPQRDVKNWALGYLTLLKSQKNSGFLSGPLDSNSPLFQATKAGRVEQKGVRLFKPKVADSLSFASFFTLIVMGGVMTGCFLMILFLLGFLVNLSGLGLALGAALVVMIVGFAISPILIDFLLQNLYRVHWENLTGIREQSAEAAEVILQVCREKSLKFPRLGIINSPIPIAFSYGSFFRVGRLVISQGVFKHLDDEEIATVYAHELNHLLQWNQSLMTLAAVPVIPLNWVAAQLTNGLGMPPPVEIILKWIGSLFSYLARMITYPVIYLSRTRIYHADHFASEITGNPNGLIRALVKLAYGMVKEKGEVKQANFLETAIRPLNIYDPYNAVATGTVYRQNSSSQRVGQVFLWELYNPWAWWLEFISTHPLTGRRISVLSHYAEQMELGTEFSMSSVLKEGSKLNKAQLRFNFILDGLTITLPLIGILVGTQFLTLYTDFSLFKGLFWGFGAGILLKSILVYPFLSKNLSSSDIFHLMADPYTSPVRGQPITLTGKLTGSMSQENPSNSDLRLQDPTGMVITHYTSRLGEFTDLKSLKSFVNVPVRAVGWFYRGIMPSFNLSQVDNAQNHLYSYHRFRSWVLGVVIIFIGLFL